MIFLSLPESEQNWRVLTLEHASDRVLALCVSIFLDELKVKILREVRQHDLEVRLSEGLAKADAFTSAERTPTHRISLLTLRG